MASPDRVSLLRQLPAIDALLGHEAWREAPNLSSRARREACRRVVAAARAGILAEPPASPSPSPIAPTLDELAHQAVQVARADDRPVLQPVVNGTGVILHTNLGRAPLADAALAAVGAVAGRYTNLELDLDSGKRDSRHGKLGAAFARLLGCGDVLVTNNNAAAVFLGLCALAGHGAQVVVSRGELVEIGGSFRMPDIMAASGARLVEVGATNRTHARDYEAALQAGARLVMKVHRSNFDMVGFTSEVAIDELAALCRQHGALLVHDLGSGLLRSSPELGDDCVQRSLAAGADLVLFSGDKLLGGPQCGIVAGRSEVVAQLASHPVMRLVRPGKLTLLALEATLRLWEQAPARGEGHPVPAVRLAARGEDELRGEAEKLAAAVASVAGHRADVEVRAVSSTPGGGSSAVVRLASFALAVRPGDGDDTGLAAALRRAERPVVGRLEGGYLLLDVRTLLPGDDEAVVAAFVAWCEGEPIQSS